MRLVMTLLVKNEDDIIESNIRFHAAQGIDAFYVMDNNSEDNTADILNDLQKEFDIKVIHNPATNYQQSKWMTLLARKAKKELGADLVVNNDADEFWSSKDGSSIKDKLDKKNIMTKVHRYNFIQSLKDIDNEDAYKHSKNIIIRPITFDKSEFLDAEHFVLPLQKIHPKVIVNPKWLKRVSGGNHSARHYIKGPKVVSDDLVVHHYPIRGFGQFKKNIENRKMISKVHPERKLSMHYQRWIKKLDEGRLEEEFEKMHLSESDIYTLERVGVISQLDTTPLSVWAANNC